MRSTAVSAVLWVLLLEATVRKTCAYVARAPLPRFRRRARPGQALEMGATSGLIETTACKVMRLVLRNGREAHVSCSVDSDALDLLQGRLRGASVRGRGWASRLGLTARSIDVDVGRVHLDVGALFRRRVLQFEQPPPSGNAVVVFSAEDFGNFLAHPLIRRTVVAGRSFVFDRHGVVVDPRKRTVAFGGLWGAEKLRIELSQAAARAPLVSKVIRSVEDGDHESGLPDDDAIASDMSGFFNNLEVDLDGPRLSFSSLSFEGSGIESGSVKLALGIVVRKLPSIRAVASF
ncbi:unnamed protein product [Ectocarpus fasciculatus]